ncbi:MAG: DoxX family protein [Planctomycetota bacterium]
MLDRLLDPTVSMQILAAAILAICFLQSGVDKLVDFKGNLGWLQGHFAKTPLRGQVLPMLAVVTALECLAGALCAAGAVQLAVSGEKVLALRGVQLAALNIVMLFFGQRIAKDYAGAATLATYFVLTGIAFMLLRLA